MCSSRIGVFGPRVSDLVVIVAPVLSELRIQGLGVIEDATLELHPGLTAVTGETGAGKTMVITGLHLLGGGRADSSRVRRGASRAVVEGLYVLPDADPDAAELTALLDMLRDSIGQLAVWETAAAQMSEATI